MRGPFVGSPMKRAGSTGSPCRPPPPRSGPHNSPSFSAGLFVLCGIRLLRTESAGSLPMRLATQGWFLRNRRTLISEVDLTTEINRSRPPLT